MTHEVEEANKENEADKEMKERDKKPLRGLQVQDSGCSCIPQAEWPFQKINEMPQCLLKQFSVCLANKCPE